MNRLAEITNATKANAIAVVNAALAVLVAYGVTLSTAQQVTTVALVNTVLVLWIGLSYTRSSKRIKG